MTQSDLTFLNVGNVGDLFRGSSYVGPYMHSRFCALPSDFNAGNNFPMISSTMTVSYPKFVNSLNRVVLRMVM